MAIQVIILAAGLGKRMMSSYPKVLHTLAGKPIIEHVLEKAIKISTNQPIIICGSQSEKLKEALQHYQLQWVMQTEQLGTGHAVLSALPLIKEEDNVLILYGDVPLISLHTLNHLIEHTWENAIGIVTTHVQNPFGYGRIKRNREDQIIGVVEEKDANAYEKKINEINTGIYFVKGKYLKQWLPLLKNHNQQHEYYLTDIVTFALQNCVPIQAVHPSSEEEILGVNDKEQLAVVERYFQKQCAKHWMKKGVTLRDPNRFDVRGNVTMGHDVIIDVNVILEGKVSIGDHCVIGPNTYLCNTTLGKHVDVRANTVLDGATIGDHCVIGPFARIRPETILAEHVHIGNFVEVKKSSIAKKSKACHLTYIGDSDIGSDVNIGAGTITCNYDGANKHKTIIRDHVFIGSGTELVAPVEIGEGATIGAGSVITENAPAHELTLSRVAQKSVAKWKRPKK